MKGKPLRLDKGIAGLNILLAVVVLLFIVGFLVMVFALLGGELEETTWETTTGTLTNSTTSGVINETGSIPAGIGAEQRLRDCALTVTQASNTTYATANMNINTGNYSVSGCTVIYTGAGGDGIYNNSPWNITGTFTYLGNTTASVLMEATTDELSDVTDWFGIIIVLTAMVVLILLTVIIISAIRGTGLVAMGSGKAPSYTA